MAVGAIGSFQVLEVRRHCGVGTAVAGSDRHHSSRPSSSVGPRSGAECAFCPVCSQAEIDHLLPAMMQMPCKPEVLQRMQQLNAKKQKLTQGMEDGQHLPDSHACMHAHGSRRQPPSPTHLLLARARATWALMYGSCLPHCRTGSLTKQKYLVMLGRCVAQDTKLAKALLQLGRKAEASKVSKRIKLTQEERKAVEAS
eukprot:COSAG01_NODE_20978_length_924_cov_1.076364_1_plen_198_part_00